MKTNDGLRGCGDTGSVGEKENRQKAISIIMIILKITNEVIDFTDCMFSTSYL